MGKLIMFPVKKKPESMMQKSIAYENLEQLFSCCTIVESCNFYLESAEGLFKNGKITENELFSLRRQGRQKRRELEEECSKKECSKRETSHLPGVYIYHPELGEKRPDGCQMDAYMGYYGNCWYIHTPLALKGRGVRLEKGSMTDKSQVSSYSDAGYNEYRVTKTAFEKLKQEYPIAVKTYLD